MYTTYGVLPVLNWQVSRLRVYRRLYLEKKIQTRENHRKRQFHLNTPENRSENVINIHSGTNRESAHNLLSISGFEVKSVDGDVVEWISSDVSFKNKKVHNCSEKYCHLLHKSENVAVKS